MSQREASIERSLTRKRAKMFKRKQRYEEQRQNDGIYCFLRTKTDFWATGEYRQNVQEKELLYAVNYLGAVFGSDPSTIPMFPAVRIDDASLSPNHFRITFTQRGFYLSDCSVSGETFHRRHLHDFERSSGHLLQLGSILIMGKSQVRVHELVDAGSQSGGECFVVLRIRHIDKDEARVVRVDENGLDDFDEIGSLVSFINGQFYLQDRNEEKVFEKATRWRSKSVKQVALAPGDIIKVGNIELFVDIRSVPELNLSHEIISSKDVGVFTFPNWLNRDTMEDRFVLLDGFGAQPTNAFFAIADGHAGRIVADMVVSVLHVNLLKSINLMKYEGNVDCKKAFKESFMWSNAMVKSFGEECFYCGSTAAAALIWNDENQKRKLFTANVGDTQCILFRRDGILKLSELHHVSNPDERQRVENLGSEIINERLKGLQVTRAFGDFALETAGVICDPFITETVLTEDDAFLVLASDGVFDFLSPEEVYSILLHLEKAEDMSKSIVHAAYKRGSTDNLTAIVVCL